MAKTTKKEFAWDNETELKVIEVSAYEKRVVTIAELKGKQYVCVATHKKIKGEWKPVKNATFTMDVWEQVADAVTDFKLGNAFGSSTTLEAPKKTSKPKAKKEEPTIKGIKTSFEEKLAKNENWSALPKDRQKDALAEVEKYHEEYGMVTIAMSKTNFITTWGKSQQQAEKELKQIKGFSRAKFTFIA